jgi:hypothetical protein
MLPNILLYKSRRTMRIKYAQVLIRSLDTIYKVQVIAVLDKHKHYFIKIHRIPLIDFSTS